MAELLVDWVLGVLKKHDEGIPITTLFQQCAAEFPSLRPETKNAVWELLIKHDAVESEIESGGVASRVKLSTHPLRKLDLDDVSEMSMGDRKLFISCEPATDTPVATLETTKSTEAPPSPTAAVAASSEASSTDDMTLATTRAHPRVGKRKEHPTSNEEPRSAPSSRERSPGINKSSQGQRPVASGFPVSGASSNSPTIKLIVKNNGNGNHPGSTAAPTAGQSSPPLSPTPKSALPPFNGIQLFLSQLPSAPTVPSVPSSAHDPTTTAKEVQAENNRFPQASSSTALHATVLSTNDISVGTCRAETQEAPSSNGVEPTGGLSSRQEHNDTSDPTESLRHTIPTIEGEPLATTEQIPSEAGAVHAEIPRMAHAALTHTTSRLSREASASPAPARHGRCANRDGSVREVTFTSYEHMQYSDGVDGVYVDPPRVFNPATRTKGRPRKSTIIVFKSKKLRDWNLQDPKTSQRSQEHVLGVLAEAYVQAENTISSITSKKRKAAPKRDTPAKKQKTTASRNGAGPSTESGKDDAGTLFMNAKESYESQIHTGQGGLSDEVVAQQADLLPSSVSGAVEGSDTGEATSAINLSLVSNVDPEQITSQYHGSAVAAEDGGAIATGAPLEPLSTAPAGDALTLLLESASKAAISGSGQEVTDGSEQKSGSVSESAPSIPVKPQTSKPPASQIQSPAPQAGPSYQSPYAAVAQQSTFNPTALQRLMDQTSYSEYGLHHSDAFAYLGTSTPTGVSDERLLNPQTQTHPLSTPSGSHIPANEVQSVSSHSPQSGFHNHSMDAHAAHRPPVSVHIPQTGEHGHTSQNHYEQPITSPSGGSLVTETHRGRTHSATGPRYVRDEGSPLPADFRGYLSQFRPVTSDISNIFLGSPHTKRKPSAVKSNVYNALHVPSLVAAHGSNDRGAETTVDSTFDESQPPDHSHCPEVPCFESQYHFTPGLTHEQIPQAARDPATALRPMLIGENNASRTRSLSSPMEGHGDLITSTKGPPVAEESQMLGTNARKKSRSKSATKASKTIDPQLQSDLTAALYMQISDELTRLPCAYQNVAGNLVLSEDKTLLEFYALSQFPPQLPAFTLAVSVITHAITSIAGSRPMELRIKARLEGGQDTFIFMFAPEEASKFATTLRTKIVAAMMAYRLKTGGQIENVADIQLAIKKPYKCEICGKRWKNKGGIEYHLKTANTTCNPNHDPEKLPKPHINAAASKEPKVPQTLKKNRTRPRSDVDDDGDHGPYARPVKTKKPRAKMSTGPIDREFTNNGPRRGSDASDASILEWAYTHAVDDTPKVTEFPKRPYKALNNENEILGEIAEEAAAGLPPDAPLNLGIPDMEISPPNIAGVQDVADRLVHISGDTLGSSECEEIVMALVHSNHGVFPAEKGLWFACVAVWLKKHPGTLLVPRSTHCAKAVDDLIAGGKLTRIDWQFKDRKKRDVTRGFITFPDKVIDEGHLEMLKMLTSETHPAFYVPSQFSPPLQILDKLQRLASRAIAARKGDELEVQYISEEESIPEIPADDESSADEFVMTDEEDMQPDEMEEDLSDEDVFGDKRPKRRRRQPGEPKRPRDESHNAAIAAGMAKRWKKIRAGVAPNTFDRTGGRGPKRLRQPTQRHLTKDERDQLARQADRRLHAWAPAAAFMPNPITGAWDQAPLPKLKRLPRQYRQGRLPEPQTFMQNPNTGAWSERPFGHGVNPIYARPARRADGNPQLGDYLNKIERGFRPVIMPNPTNRIYLPAAPSRKLLRAAQDDPEAALNFGPGVRISKITGRPKRAYTKRAATVEASIEPENRRGSWILVSNTYETEDEHGNVSRLPDLSGRSVRPGNYFPTRVSDTDDNEDLLAFPKHKRNNVLLGLLETKKLEPHQPMNPGLESVPPGFGLKVEYKGFAVDYISRYQSITFSKPRVIDDNCNPGKGSYTMNSWSEYQADGYNVHWDDATAFTMEDIAYDQLLDDDEGLPKEDEPAVKKLKLITGAPLQKKLAYKDGKLNRVQARYNTLRVLSAIPSDFKDLFEDPQQAAEEFGVTVAKPNDHTRMRKRNTRQTMPASEEQRFIVACVLIRTLLGGLDLQVDWVIVSTIFQNWSVNFLQKHFLELNKSYRQSIERLATDFQEPFLAAYAKGDIAPLNYDDPCRYNWNKLINWTIRHVDTSLGNKPAVLLSSRNEIHKQNIIVLEERDGQKEREIYFGSLFPVYKRMEAFTSNPNVVLPKPRRRPDQQVDKHLLAKSVARAVALTPEEHWDTKVAERRLKELGDRLIKPALDELIKSKVLVHKMKGRAIPARHYETTDAFHATLRIKIIKETQFLEAVAYKNYLDQQFKSGNKYVRAPYMSNEGMIMVITSLVAHDRVRIDPINVPMERMGLLGGGGYESKRIPKEKYIWDMDIYPTETYLFNDAIEPLQSYKYSEPPTGGPDELGAIPAWFDCGDRLLRNVWKRVLGAVGQIVALRSGTDMEALTATFKPTLEEWELRVLMDWGTDMGIFRSLSDEGNEGWTVGEWWWAVVGMAHTDPDEIEPVYAGDPMELYTAQQFVQEAEDAEEEVY